MKGYIFSSLTTSWLSRPQMWWDLKSQNTRLPFRTMRMEVVGASAEPMACFRSWFALADAGHAGGGDSLWVILSGPMMSLYRRAPSLFPRGHIFRVSSKATLHPCMDPYWSLHRTGLNPRGSSRHHLFLKQQIPFITKSCHFYSSYHFILFPSHFYFCHPSPSCLISFVNLWNSISHWTSLMYAYCSHRSQNDLFQIQIWKWPMWPRGRETGMNTLMVNEWIKLHSYSEIPLT